MRRILHRSRLLLLACVLASTFTGLARTGRQSSAAVDQAIEKNVGNPVEVHQFFTRLQQAAARQDKDTVASMVRYPITVKLNGKSTILRTPRSFLEHYDRILTPEITAAIARQRYENLFVNYQGVMIGNGQVWIAGICRDKACKESDIKIRTIQSTAHLK